MGDEGATDRDEGLAKPAAPRRRARRRPTLLGFATTTPGKIGAPQIGQPDRTKSGTQPKAPSRPATKPRAVPGRGGGARSSPLPKAGGSPPRKLPPKKPFPTRPLPELSDPTPEPAAPETAASRWDSAPVPPPEAPSVARTEVGPPPQRDDPPATASETSTDVGPPPEPPATENEPEPVEIEGEPTQVSASAPTPEHLVEATAPAIELPDSSGSIDEMGFAHTQPLVHQPEPAAAEASSPELYDARPPATRPERDDFLVESTVVVEPGAMTEPAPVYSLDVESGRIELASAATYVAPRPEKRRNLGLLVGVGLAAFVLVAAGFAIVWFIFLTPSDTSNPVAEVGGDTTEPTPGDPADDDLETTDPTEPSEGDPGESGDPGEEPTGEGPSNEEPGAEGPGSEEPAAPEPAAPEEVAPAAASREAIDAYELSRVPTVRRAQRMSEAARVRQANRFKARALAAYRRNEFATAEGLYRNALGFNSWDVGAIEGMARSTARQGRFPEAIAWANLAVERNSRSAATFRVLGDVWRQAGHDDEALRAWRRGRRRHPDDRHLRRRIRELRR